ncbi:hypothetical protein SGUI_2891 [Serinicoccus hydrothermalis]|uniref:Uncharacterized protein n=1 Tax=Serinicoccus hydrothermalis TaxID=1758689 RepID=A0A1B1NFU2_9MICO|nr:hypothetical protein SGUI_2891 [Serinicoccus hydrothermalis]
MRRSRVAISARDAARSEGVSRTDGPAGARTDLFGGIEGR